MYSTNRANTPQNTYRLASAGTTTSSALQQKYARPSSATAARRNPTPSVSQNKLQPTSGATRTIVEEKHYKKNERGERQLATRKYYQERFLGKGGFAQCFLFRQVGNNKIYAAKVIDKQSLQKENVKQKLYSEIKIHSSLSHRHIVNFVRYFETDENVYILLELCNCGSMMDLLKSRTRLTEQEARFFLHQLLLACLYMTEKRVIHRDLKLGNLFLTDKMEIKIGDFGLATQVEFDGERKKTICGTPNYIAPEILLSKGHSYEVDTWSIGVILYTMLVGTPPFETKDVKETYKKIKHNDYIFPEDINVSLKAKNLVQRILRRNPEDRPDIKSILMDPFFAGTSVDYCPASLLEYSKAHALKIGEIEDLSPAAYSSKHPELQQQLQKLSQGERVPFKQIENTIHQRPATAVDTALKPLSTNYNSSTTATRRTRPVSVATGNGNNENVNPLLPSSMAKPTHNLLKPAVSEHPAQTMVEKTMPVLQQQQPEFAVPQPRSQPNSQPNSQPSSTQSTPTHQTSQTSRLPTPKRRSPPSEAEEKRKPVPPSSDSLENSRSKGPPVKKSRTPSNAPVSPNSIYSSPTSLNFDPMMMDDDGVDTPLSLPAVWVTHWADFSSKYGLTYLFNTGVVGAVYNDSTKMIFNPATQEVQYFERKLTEEGSYDEKIAFPIKRFPAAMQKKVTLIKYFAGYLEKMKTNEVSLPSSFSSESGRSCYKIDSTNLVQEDCSEDVVVKRWLKTAHAIIFRLSNKAVQVCFYDQTEIILSSDTNNVAYTDSQGVRTTYALHKIVKNTTPEIAKRLKYTKDVLCQLINTPKN